MSLADVRGDLRAFWAATRKEWRILRRYKGTFLSFAFWPIALPLAFVFQAEAFAGRTRRHGGRLRAREPARTRSPASSSSAGRRTCGSASSCGARAPPCAPSRSAAHSRRSS